MSRKFRWFLLASCAFVVLMGGADAVKFLVAGPSGAGARPERIGVARSTETSEGAPRVRPARRLDVDAELARGEARRQ